MGPQNGRPFLFCIPRRIFRLFLSASSSLESPPQKTLVLLLTQPLISQPLMVPRRCQMMLAPSSGYKLALSTAGLSVTPVQPGWGQVTKMVLAITA